MTDQTPDQPTGQQPIPWGPSEPNPSSAQQSPAAQTEYPGYGPPQPAHYGQPQYGQPQYGQPQPLQYGHPQYGQPQYGQPQPLQYGHPQYGQPHYGQPQYGQPFPGYSQPKRNTKKIVLIVVGSLVALVAVLVVIGVIAYQHDGTAAGPKRTLAIPASSGRYTQATTASAIRVGSLVQQELAAADKTFKDAKIGVFSADSSPQPGLLLLALSAQNNPDFARELRGQSETAEAKSVFDGAHATNIHSYDAGPLGGILQCGSLSTLAGSVPVCVWIDKSTLGVTVALARQDEATFAADTLTLRNDTEH